MIGFILWKSYERFLQPIDIGTGATLTIAAVGLLINVASVYVLQGEVMSLNERGAFYHILGDTSGSVAVILSTIIIEFTGFHLIDPITAVVIAAIVTWSAIKVLGGSGAVFFHRMPLQRDQVLSEIKQIDGVVRIEDFQAWQICSQITISTAHLESNLETMEDGKDVLHQVHEILEQKGVDHATIEICPCADDRHDHLDKLSH